MNFDAAVRFNTKIETEEFKSDVDKLKSYSKKAFAAIGLAASGVAIGVSTVGINFESAFAGVKKTVNATESELNSLRKGIRDMAKDIPLAADEIAGIAEAAGQLGIETKNIESFTRVMADLGVATNLTGEEAASTLAKFANITQMPQEKFANLGSTIVALGNNLATTEADIAAMSLRLAGAGSQIGLTEAQILSFSGALSSVGIEAEAGGTAFSKLMTDMQLAVETNSDTLSQYASVAGMTGEQFKIAFKDNAANAIIEFIKGLNNTEQNGKSATAVLADMGITEVRLSDALKRAAGASDVFADAIKLGNDAWEENNALTKEAEQRYSTTESKLKILGNQAKDLGITVWDAFSGQFGEAIDFASEKVEDLSAAMESGSLSGAIKNVGKLFGNIIKTITTLVNAVLPPLVSVLGFVGENFGLIASVVGTATAAIVAYKAAAALANIVETTALAISAARTSGVGALSIATALLTGNLTKEKTLILAKTVAEGAAVVETEAHTAAQIALKAAMTATPIGIVIAALAALVVATVAVVSAINSETEAEKENRLALEASAKANKELAESLEESKKAREEATSSVVSEYNHIETLYTELEALTDANGKVSEAEKGRAEYIINTLNEALGTEISLTKDMTVAYGDAEGKIYDLIEAKKAEALADAYKDDWINALERQKTAQDNLSQAQADGAETAAKLTEAQAKYDEALKTYNDKKAQLIAENNWDTSSIGDMQELTNATLEEAKAFGNAKLALDNATKAHAPFAEEITNAENSLNSITATMTTYEDGMAALAEGNTDKAIKTFQNVGSAATNMGEETNSALAQAGSAYHDNLNLLMSAMNTYLKTGSQSAYNLIISTATQLASSRAEYEAAGGQLADGLVTTMNGDIDLSGLISNINASAASINKVAASVGTDIGSGMINGIDESTGKVKASGVTCGEAALAGFAEGADCHSPSKTTHQIGIYVDEGMVQGLYAGASRVSAAARLVAHDALVAAANELGVASPAKEAIPIGEYFDEGLAVGIENEKGTVENAAADVAEAAIDAAESIINRSDIFEKLGKNFTDGIKENSESNTKKYEDGVEVLDYKLSFGLISEEDYFAEMTRLRNQYLAEGTKEWYDCTEKIYDHQKDTELDHIKWLFDQGLISEEEYYKQIGEYRDKYFTEGTKEWQEFTDEINEYNKNSELDYIEWSYKQGIISEREYLQKLVEYRDKYFVKGSKEWQEYTEEIFGYYKDEATEAIESIGEQQDDLIDTFEDHGKLVRTVTVENWFENGDDLEWTELNTSTQELDEVKEYGAKLNIVEQRLLDNGYDEEFVNDFMAKIREMSVEDGLEYVRLLADADDATFNTHIGIEAEKDVAYKEIAAGALDDEIEDAAEIAKEAWTNALTAAGFEIPEGFFEIGKDSAQNFGEGFSEQLASLFNPIKETMMALMPGLSYENAGLATASATFAPVYNFYSSSDTTSEQIQAAQNASERDKLSGGY